MRYYPLFLDLTDARCLVAGAGEVGLRKLRTLLECPVREVLVIDRRKPDGEGTELLNHPAVRFECRDLAQTFAPAFVPSLAQTPGGQTAQSPGQAPASPSPLLPGDLADIQGMALVFACTSSPEINQALAACCRAHGVLCNVANSPQAGNFIVPAHVECGPITAALSTGGASPALARALKLDLEKWLGQRYSFLVCLLEKLRPDIIGLGLGSDADAQIFRAVVAQRETLAAAFAARDFACCEILLRDALPSALHRRLAELLHELD